ncbi:hypothetical protein DSAG12_04255 [Promethearchaeum syntrophicum]|uniref:Uncharacterized protein n=1 Tax=Promethearchaeum syntrophicum TaxID=2594042 RepID=A0AC61ZTZ6_9ARCH|nr:hypothetical protein [Candidatus Prometheoarchaeum syntrophicum]
MEKHYIALILNYVRRSLKFICLNWTSTYPIKEEKGIYHVEQF